MVPTNRSDGAMGIVTPLLGPSISLTPEEALILQSHGLRPTSSLYRSQRAAPAALEILLHRVNRLHDERLLAPWAVRRFCQAFVLAVQNRCLGDFAYSSLHGLSIDGREESGRQAPVQPVHDGTGYLVTLDADALMLAQARWFRDNRRNRTDD